MKRYQKVLLLTAGILVIGGGILATAGLAMGGVPGFWITEKGIQTAEDIRGTFVEKKVPLSDVSSLDINCVEGNVEFLLGDDFHLEYGYDDAFLSVKNEKKDGIYHFTSDYVKQAGWYGAGFFWGDTVNSKESYVRIYVPRGTKLKDLNLVNEYGKIKMDINGAGCEKTVMKMESGSAWVNGLTSGHTEVQAEYGDVEMEDCDVGKMTLRGEGGSYRLSDIQAEEMKLEEMYGEIALSRISGGIMEVKSESGNTKIEEMSGKELSLVNEYGEITMQNVTTDTFVHIKSGDSGNIRIQDIKTGQMKLETEGGDVEGKKVELGTADIQVAYGKCELYELNAKDVKVSSESGNVELAMAGKEKEYQMSLMTEYGEVSVNGKKQGNNILLEREKAKVKLEVKSEEGNIRVDTE